MNEFLLAAAEEALADLIKMTRDEFILLQESCGTTLAYAIDPDFTDDPFPLIERTYTSQLKSNRKMPFTQVEYTIDFFDLFTKVVIGCSAANDETYFLAA